MHFLLCTKGCFLTVSALHHVLLAYYLLHSTDRDRHPHAAYYLLHSISFLLQAKIDALTEQLRNAEDKLCAAEHCKKLLNDEMAVLDQAQQKASSRLEVASISEHFLFRTSLSVLRHSACCCHRTKRICDVFLPSLSWLSSASFPAYHSLHYYLLQTIVSSNVAKGSKFLTPYKIVQPVRW